MPLNSSSQAILYFGNDWSAENRTSSHHIARWLAQGNTVYYIECPGLRAPRGSSRDAKKAWNKVRRFLRGPQPVEGGVRVWTLLQIPLHRFRLVRWLNRWLLWASMRVMMWLHGIRSPISWFLVPHVGSLAGRLSESLCVYYCIDDYAALPASNPQAVQAMDDQLTRDADVVFVAAEALIDHKRSLNPNSFVSPHGVDVEHFQQAQNTSLPLPADVAELPQPVIGFFGLVERWIDIELIDFLARQRPDWTFLIVGHVAIPATDVPQHGNLHFIGKRPYDELPAYGRKFNVAIIPYRLNRQVLNANPLKLREYLAMGKPIVSVSTPEIEKYRDVIRIANTPAEFLSHLDQAVAQCDSLQDVERRMEAVADATWDARMQAVWSRVQSALNKSIVESGEEPTAVAETTECAA